MVQATLEPQWVPKEICPATCRIEKVTEKHAIEKSGRSTQFFELLLMCNGQHYTYDAKYGDKAFLVNTIGADTDLWVGKTIRVVQGEKYKNLASSE